MVQNTYSFVVRIWQEAVDVDGNLVAWRGSVDDVSTGDRRYFEDLASLAGFIRGRIGLPDENDRWQE